MYRRTLDDRDILQVDEAAFTIQAPLGHRANMLSVVSSGTQLFDYFRQGDDTSLQKLLYNDQICQYLQIFD